SSDLMKPQLTKTKINGHGYKKGRTWNLAHLLPKRRFAPIPQSSASPNQQSSQNPADACIGGGESAPDPQTPAKPHSSPSPFNGDLRSLGSDERNSPKVKAERPSERARASHWAGVRGENVP